MRSDLVLQRPMDFFHGLVQVPLPAFPLEKAFLLEHLVVCESRYGDSQKKPSIIDLSRKPLANSGQSI